MEPTIVTDPRQLESITNIVHDCWFSVDDIVHRSDDRVVEINFWRDQPSGRKVLRDYFILKRVQMQEAEYVLRINHVRHLDVHDKARVGKYDFDRLVYRKEIGEISVLTGIPLEMRITVSDFRLEVEPTGRTSTGQRAWAIG